MIGDSTSSLVGFFGTAPVGQQAASITSVATDSSATKATAINAINTALKNIGIVA